MTLIRLGGCPGRSESSLGAQSFCLFCHEVAQMMAVIIPKFEQGGFSIKQWVQKMKKEW